MEQARQTGPRPGAGQTQFNENAKQQPALRAEIPEATHNLMGSVVEAWVRRAGSRILTDSGPVGHGTAKG